jgi:hypothetical protein
LRGGLIRAIIEGWYVGNLFEFEGSTDIGHTLRVCIIYTVNSRTQKKLNNELKIQYKGTAVSHTWL